jgi:hypothetical protein
VRLEFDEENDRAKLVIVDERQTYESGHTEAVYVTPNQEDEPGVMVQIGFESPCKLLWISVEPASRALPRELLEGAKGV